MNNVNYTHATLAGLCYREREMKQNSSVNANVTLQGKIFRSTFTFQANFCVKKVLSGPQRKKKIIIWIHSLSDRSLIVDMEKQSKTSLQQA